MKRGVVSFILGAIIGYVVKSNLANRDICRAYDNSEKNRYLYRTAAQWIKKECEGDGVCEYLLKHEYKDIAIYGLSYLGANLIERVRGSGICVRYGIDGGTVQFKLDVPVYAPNDDLEDVDAVIVTPVYSFDKIRENLKNRLSCPILSLADIVFDE